MIDPIIKVQNLSRHFGQQLALQDISFSIQPGSVYGLVGSNGAGKTTLIKHLMGLYRAQTGWVRVFDSDPAIDPETVLSQIGYLSEDRELPEWMRVDELLRYTASFYPTWDWNYALDLISEFGMDAAKKIKQLSRGAKAQVGLIAAVAHRPQLLLLDEPSSGLDPIVRKDILTAIVKIVADENRTVIFSSHLLDEIEMMSDILIMLDRGKLTIFDEVDAIKSKYFSLTVRWPDDKPTPKLDQALIKEQTDHVVSMIVTGLEDQIKYLITSRDGELIHFRHATLPEVFMAKSGRIGESNVSALASALSAEERP